MRFANFDALNERRAVTGSTFFRGAVRMDQQQDAPQQDTPMNFRTFFSKGDKGEAAARLPDAAAAKIDTLRQRAADARALFEVISDRRSELEETKLDLQSRIKFLKQPRGGGGADVNDDHPDLVSKTKELETLLAELEKLRPFYDARAQEWRAQSNLLLSIERWVTGLPSGTAIRLHGGKPAAVKGADYDKLVREAREERQRLKAELHRVNCAPLPSSAAKANVAAQVRKLAEIAAPDVLPVVERGGDIRWPTEHNVIGVTGSDAIVGIDQTNVPAALAWLFPEQMTAALCKQIDALADDDAALTDQQRVKEQARLALSLLDVEREEEHAITLAAAAGVSISRREDADPRAVLGLSSELPV